MKTIIDRFFAAMQAGACSEEEILGLFSADATYVEPFSGSVRMHKGTLAIRNALREGWRNPMPRMTIGVDRIDVDGANIRAEWTCYSPALPGGKGRGVNLFTIRDGLIVRLETRFLQE